MVVGDIWVANYINGLFGKPSDSSLEEFSLILCRAATAIGVWHD